VPKKAAVGAAGRGQSGTPWPGQAGRTEAATIQSNRHQRFIRIRPTPFSPNPRPVESKNRPRRAPLADKLRENQLATVRALPKRFAELDRNKPLVASISITPVSKANAELA